MKHGETTGRVAALYVDPKGVYAGLPDVEVWDEERDARTYAGPWPVVAHPPCARWSPLAYINRRRIPGYEIGDDGGCFVAALDAVRQWGGVLEHPAGSLAWKRYELPRPTRGLWMRSLFDPGWVTEISQVAYGHRARKRTWLYCVGHPWPLDWSEPVAAAQVSSFRHAPAGAHVPCESSRVRGREASVTPERFRDELIRLAKCEGSP